MIEEHNLFLRSMPIRNYKDLSQDGICWKIINIINFGKYHLTCKFIFLYQRGLLNKFLY